MLVNTAVSSGSGHVFLCWWPAVLRAGFWAKYVFPCANPVTSPLWTGVVQLRSSLLTVGAITVLLPSVFYMASQGQPSYSELSTDEEILHTSHGVRAYHISLHLKFSSPLSIRSPSFCSLVSPPESCTIIA